MPTTHFSQHTPDLKYIYLRTSMQVKKKSKYVNWKKVPICLSVDTTSTASLSKNKFCLVQYMPLLQNKISKKKKIKRHPRILNFTISICLPLNGLPLGCEKISVSLLFVTRQMKKISSQYVKLTSPAKENRPEVSSKKNFTGGVSWCWRWRNCLFYIFLCRILRHVLWQFIFKIIKITYLLGCTLYLLYFYSKMNKGNQ